MNRPKREIRCPKCQTLNLKLENGILEIKFGKFYCNVKVVENPFVCCKKCGNVIDMIGDKDER
jgi:hypothetical protein